jgi:hypothetical protein
MKTENISRQKMAQRRQPLSVGDQWRETLQRRRNQKIHEDTQTKRAELVDPLNTQLVKHYRTVTSPVDSDQEDVQLNVQEYRTQMTIQFVTGLSCETAQWHKDSARNSCDFSRYNNALYLSRMAINAMKGPRHWTPMPWSLRKRWKIEE